MLYYINSLERNRSRIQCLSFGSEVSEYLNQLSETIDIRRNVRKKGNFFEADISAANGGTNCRVYERFSIFQIIGKNPKFKNIFFDEKSCKVWRGMKNILPDQWILTTDRCPHCRINEFLLPITTKSMNFHYKIFGKNILHTPSHFATFFIGENVFKFRIFPYDLENAESFKNAAIGATIRSRNVRLKK